MDYEGIENFKKLKLNKPENMLSDQEREILLRLTLDFAVINNKIVDYETVNLQDKFYSNYFSQKDNSKGVNKYKPLVSSDINTNNKSIGKSSLIAYNIISDHLDNDYNINHIIKDKDNMSVINSVIDDNSSNISNKKKSNLTKKKNSHR